MYNVRIPVEYSPRGVLDELLLNSVLVPVSDVI